jgi:hypothetical protein
MRVTRRIDGRVYVYYIIEYARCMADPAYTFA